MFARLLIILSIIMMLGGCSTTPGDAAGRGGHPEQAADLYRRGAEQGDALAAFKLGRLVEKKSVSSDVHGSAGSWYIKACNLGDITSCHNAGVGYENGSIGLPKDIEKALTYYLRAAKSGYMQSQYNVGSFYSMGYFMNDIEGYKWLLLADEAARSCISVPLCKWVLDDPPGHNKKLRGRMTAGQISEAEKQAKSWTAEE